MIKTQLSLLAMVTVVCDCSGSVTVIMCVKVAFALHSLLLCSVALLSVMVLVDVSSKSSNGIKGYEMLPLLSSPGSFLASKEIVV